MTYKNYPGYSKTYILVHNTGFGVMEAPYEEKEIVFEANTLEEAQAEAKRLTDLNNPGNDTSWKENTYHININTLTDKGKELLNDFHIKVDQLSQKAKDEGWKPVKVGGVTVFMQPCKEFDDEVPKSSFGKSRIIWSDPKP